MVELAEVHGRKYAAVHFGKRPGKRALAGVRSFEERYWEPMSQTWMVRCRTLGDARAVLAWAVAHRIPVGQDFIETVERRAANG